MLKTYLDQTGEFVDLINAPVRIVSLVPSQTELLSALGLDNEVVGITKFCVHPKQWYMSKTRIGGTKTPNIEKIHRLKPDLILANKEENNREDILKLRQHFPVWVSDIHNLEDAIQMIHSVGLMTNKSLYAESITKKIKLEIDRLKTEENQDKPLRVCYLIWKKPYMSIGSDTFIHDMIAQLGWQNVFEHKLRYPITDLEEIMSLHPDRILLSSEPYPFKEIDIAAFKPIHGLLVDGECFSWYGSRLTHSFSYFRNLKALILSA